MKVIIAGGRDFTDWCMLAEAATNWSKDTESHRAMPIITEVVSGGARGADKLGEAWARRQSGIHIKRMPADWNRYKKAAGPIRNRQMAEYVHNTCPRGGGLLAFWDRQSSGTRNMIEVAIKIGLMVQVCHYTNPSPVQSGT